MHKFLSHYENPEKFNEEFIYMKQNDDVLSYIKDIATALEVVDGIKFVDAKMNSDESTFKTRVKEGTKWISIEESRLNLITLKFKIFGKDKGKDREEVIEKEILFPKLINDFYIILNGSKYYPIYQIIDASTYRTPKSLTLKTLLMPIVLKTSIKEFEGYKLNETEQYRGRIFILDLFKYKINILNYYFAKMGFTETVKYFGFSEEDLGVIESDEIDQDVEGYRFFNLTSSLTLYASEEVLSKCLGLDFICSVIDVCNSKINLDKLDDLEYWKKKLGIIFTKNTNTQLEKASKILISYERILDNRIKQVLRVRKEDKQDTYSIMRWMIKNYDILLKQDNMDLRYKRIRLYEYLLHPLLIKFSNSTYRLLNSKTVTFSNIKSIFNNISQGFVIKKLQTNELLRYANAVNTIDLFSSALKVSFRGPQSLAEGKKSISIRYRGLHPSYVGILGLTASSASDPGMTATFSPFIKTDGCYFISESEMEEHYLGENELLSNCALEDSVDDL
jgi:hypothetical protein